MNRKEELQELEEEKANRRQVERDARRLAFLYQASATLAARRDADGRLRTLAEICVPDLADWAIVDAWNGTRLRRIAVTHFDPSRAELAEKIRGWTDLVSESGSTRAVLTGETESAPELTAPLRRRLEADEDKDAHRRLLRETGARSYFIAPLRGDAGIVGAVTLLFAESGRRYLSEEVSFASDLCVRAAIAVEHARLLEAQERLVSQMQSLLSVVSHDLRNPLSSVLMTTHLLRDNVDVKARRHGALIERNADRMLRLVNDLLDLASIEAGQLAVTRRTESVESVLEDALNVLRPIAAEREIDLIARPASGEVACDRGRVQQVLSNLIGNAIKFTPEGGNVTLTARQDGPRVRFEVADTGPGIAPADRARLFDRFWQSDRGDRRGIGLGLSIAKGLVEAHGGQIGVDSKVGAGSTFWFTI
ncbi:MAG: GAF domain-containing sensor histidine kinase [Chloroflexota bacterium]|nr:GAF domain-containing sensor histidine kinase [Chloroflexota bacterium]